MAREVDARTRALQEQSTALVTANHVHPKDDIVAERRRATFDNTDLLHYLNGGKDKLERRGEFAKMLAATPWGDKSRRHFLTREEEYVGALQASLGIWEKMQQEKLGLEDGLMMRQLVDFPGGLELHIGMFIPTLLGQGSPEQQSKWLPPSMNLQIIGTYAQTELGHGTFVRGLETTATYDPALKEFIMHSPTLTSTKWWPGGMGKTATHAIVMARLIVKGRDYGPHAFVVQLRSLVDHKPMPGVQVGDIGPKFGYNGVDNGFMRMDHVRIPHDAMMARFSKVSPEGDYIPPPPANSKASYATMVYVRADIVKNAGGQLAKAVTIATRYAAVRRQTAAKAGELELQVLDYQNCAHTLLPLISSAYALWFMGEDMMRMYKQFEEDRDRGDFSNLPELHALSSGLKAVCTWTTADGIEACRRTCGGHGFSLLSGLPRLFTNYVQNVTWEGDNNVLCLQVARYLLKSLAAAAQGNAPKGSAAYLDNVQVELGSKCRATSEACWDDLGMQLAALTHRATRLAVVAADELKRAGGGKVSFEGPAWNASTVVMITLARAHGELALLHTFASSLERLQGQLPGATLGVLAQLARLFGLGLVERAQGELMEDAWLGGGQAAALRARARALLVELRPNAVALVDAFGYEDYNLNSALGRYDGDVYTALLEMAQGSPLNESQEGPAWHNVLKPVMHKRPLPKL